MAVDHPEAAIAAVVPMLSESKGESSKIIPLVRRQYTAGFLAGSFGLSLRQAREILTASGDDRTAAAEAARKKKALGTI